MDTIARHGLAFVVEILLTETEAVYFALQRVVTLLANQNLSRLSWLADNLGLAEGLPNERELWFCIAKDSYDSFTCVDTYSDAGFLSILQSDWLDEGDSAAGKIWDSHWVMIAKKSWIDFTFTDF